MLVSKFTKDGIAIEILGKGSQKKLLAECDGCKKSLEIQMKNYHRSQEKSGNSGLTYCVGCMAKKTAKERIGKYTSPRKGKFIKPEDRKRTPYIGSDGYRVVFDAAKYKEDLKNEKSFKGYRKEHILLMETQLGRKLEKNEEVHHIDGDKLNNALSNLIVVTNVEHQKLHAQFTALLREFMVLGKIRFDRLKMKYEVINE